MKREQTHKSDDNGGDEIAMRRTQAIRSPAITRLLAIVLLVTLAPAAANARDFEGRVPAEPGGDLRVELDAGSVVLEGHDRAEVRVDALAVGLGARQLDFRLEAKNNRVTLRGKGATGWLPSLIGGGPHVRIHIRVPNEFSVDIRTAGGDIEIEGLEGRVRARTTGGRIVLGRIEGEVEAETSGGPIEADEIEGSVRARTSGGPIRLVEIEGRVDAQTSGGGIDVLGASGEVRARTSGGSIRVRFDDQPGGRLETSGGSIEVELPEGDGVRLDARTSGGTIVIDPELEAEGRIEPTRVSAEIGGGGERLRVETSGGSIHIRVR
jgi:hypothetical protein